MTIDKNNKAWRLQAIIPCFMGLFFLALMLRNSEVAINYVSKALRLCTEVVIPSLFPFMVVSDILVSSGVARPLGSLLKKPMKTLFGVSGDGALAITLGALCGFPIGARCAVSLFDAGSISKSECERLLAISSTPSSAFLISAAGISLFGSRSFGRALYATVLISSWTVGILQNILSKRKAKRKKDIQKRYPKSFPSPTNPRRAICASDISRSIASSADAMLHVCAFVVFFTAFVGVLCEMIDSVSLHQSVKAAICAIFELTSGVAESATVSNVNTGAVIAAFAAGWSGISVHLQIASICKDKKISLSPYFRAKLACGALCAAIISLYLKISPPSFHSDTPTALTIPPMAYPITAAFILCVLFGTLCKLQKLSSHLKREKMTN